MNDIIFWGLTCLFMLIGVVFLFVFLMIADRNKKTFRVCDICGWEEEITDQFDCCSQCGYFNWDYKEDKVNG